MNSRTLKFGFAAAFALLTCWAHGSDEKSGNSSPEAACLRTRGPLTLHYDLFLSEGSRINDASGKKHEGTLSGGSIVAGRRRNAVELAGKGMIEVTGESTSSAPSGQPMTVGAVCFPTRPDGVIASMGDDREGFSLYIKGGVPHFAVRIGGKLTRVADSEPVPLDQWCHVLGSIDRAGKLRLIVNGNATEGPEAGFLSGRPAGNLRFGSECGAAVAGDRGLTGWYGRLQEMRLYRGTLDAKADGDELKDWASLSDCGCK